METFIFGALGLIALGINTVILSLLSRRLLGVPVGWPRLIVVSLLVSLTSSAVVAWLFSANYEIDAHGDIVGNVTAPGLVLLLLLTVITWLILGPAVLLLLEMAAPTGTLPGPIEVLRDLPARYRRGRRYSQVVRLATKNGLGRYFGAGRRAERTSVTSVGARLRITLTEGGVTFVKLGQMLATRPDLIGSEVAGELSRLQADVPAEPWETVSQTLEGELRRPIEEVFATIENEPLAAASVGQVYRATLANETEVVVKVQRSGARALAAADLDIITRIAAWLERSTAWGQQLGTVALAEGFAASLREELDYTVEAANVAGVRASVRAAVDPTNELVVVPAVYDQFTTPRLLVMERVAGVPISRAFDRLAVLPSAHRKALAEALVAVVLQQLLVDGIFHADLHAGNVLLRDDDTLALLDFGSVGRLDNVTRGALSRLMMAIRTNDAIVASDALLTVLDRPAGLDQRALERDLGALLLRFGPSGSLGAAVPQLFATLIDHGFSVPSQVAAAFRALAALEGTIALIDPDLDLVQATEVAAKKMMAEMGRPASVRAMAEEQLWQLLPVLQRLPRRMDEITRAMTAGELSVRVRLLADPSDRSFVRGVVGQLVTTAAAATSAIIATWLLVSAGGPVLSGQIRLFPLLSASFYLIAVALGVRVLASAFFHDGTRDDHN